MQTISDLIVLLTTNDADIMNELAEARRAYWAPEPAHEPNLNPTFRPNSADVRLQQFCVRNRRTTGSLPSEDCVLRQILRLGLSPAQQIRELRRGRYLA